MSHPPYTSKNPHKMFSIKHILDFSQKKKKKKTYFRFVFLSPYYETIENTYGQSHITYDLFNKSGHMVYLNNVYE